MNRRDAGRAPEHSTYVQMIATGGFFASCSTCGPDPFPDRLILAAAERDARAHGPLVHMYDEETLRRHNEQTAAERSLT